MINQVSGTIIVIYSLVMLGLFSWYAWWISDNETRLNEEEHTVYIWTIIAVSGTMFSSFCSLLLGCIIFVRDDGDQSDDQESSSWCVGLIGLAGFVGSCGSIHIWRTFDLDSGDKKMVELIGFSGISSLYLLGLFFLFSIILTCTSFCCNNEDETVRRKPTLTYGTVHQPPTTGENYQPPMSQV